MITVQKLAGPAPGGESADSPFFYEEKIGDETQHVICAGSRPLIFYVVDMY